MNRSILTLLMFFAAGAANAQIIWERLAGPNGTFQITCAAYDADANAHYVGTPTGGGIFVSTDDGATWNPKVTGLPANLLVTDIAFSGGAVYAVAGKIYKSTDGGNFWEELTASPGGVTNLHAAAGGVLFASSDIQVGGTGIFRSTDGGATWSLSAAGIPTYTIVQVHYQSVSGIVSDGSGNFWCAVNSGNPSTQAGVYVSTDGGSNWTRSVSGLLADAWVKPIGRGPNGMLYVGVRNRLYKSTDNGSTWTQCDSIPMATFWRPNAISINGSGEVFVATQQGLFRGAKGGTGWTKLGAAILPTNIPDVAAGSGAVISGGTDLFGTHGGSFRSTDNGANWEYSNTGMNNAFVGSLTVTPSGRIMIGLGGGGRIEYSTDGGSTFTRVVAPYTGQYISGAIGSLRGSGSSAVVGGSAQGIFTSTDAGATWVKSWSVGTRAFALNGAGDFHAGTGTGVVKSTDNGNTWNHLSGGGDSYSVFVTAAGTILSGTFNSGINRTTDGGGTWTNSGTSPFGNVTIGRFIQLPGGTIYVHTLVGLFRSTNEGASWSAVTGTPVGQQYRTLAASGGTIFLGTPDGLFVSEDGATTWTQHKTGLHWTILDHLALAPDGRLYGSGGSAIYRTRHPVTTSVSELPGELPSGYALLQNYPNPFNPSTTVEFSIPAASEVEIAIYSAAGERIAVLADRTMGAGRYRAEWEAAGSPTGVYFCSMRAVEAGGRRSFAAVRKMLLLK